MHYAHNESGKKHMEGMELPNQGKISLLRQKETYKYLGILQADTIKQVGIKEKMKNISGEWENYLKPNYIAGTL